GRCRGVSGVRAVWTPGTAADRHRANGRHGRHAMSNNVVPLRPGIQMVRASAGAAVLRIDANVKMGHLLRGLAAEGLSLRHDPRTGEFVILQREIEPRSPG